jgi:hypothetical protein
MDVRNMPKGWRMLVMFPMTAPYGDGNGGTEEGTAGFEVCAEHVIVPGMDPVYVLGHTDAAHVANPLGWTDMAMQTDAYEAMRCVLGRTGWAGVIG